MTRMYLLTLWVSAICAVACVSAVSDQQDVRGDATTTGRYWLNTASQMSWPRAYQVCKDRSSHLAVINSQEEADNLLTLMTIYDLQIIHIGLTDKYIEGRYVSVLGEDIEEIGYNTWRVGFPNITLGNCAGFSRASGEVGLFNYDCSVGVTSYRSFCEERRWDEYTLIPDHGYYNRHVELRTWTEARKVCRQEGAHLYIINSEEEARAVNDVMYPFAWVFVGVTDTLLTGTHVTIYNDRLDKVGFNNWQSVPSNRTDYPYVAVFQSIFLAPQINTTTTRFVCEHELITA